MKLPLAVLILTGILLGIVSVACSGGGALTLEEYFERLEEIDADSRDATDGLEEDYNDALEEAGDDEDRRLDALRDYFRRFMTAFERVINEVDDLNPPAEAEDAHDEFVEAQRDARDVLGDFTDELGDADNLTEADEAGQKYDSDVNDASDEIDEKCVALQDIADENEIDADLDCLG